ncbi:MAG: winged helix-turn-helix transcriptional regulator [Cyclobacteriaceae bacterium]|jgi:DNA-binding MarR family transcriptional regulator|nr:winged helix-turn-helix transcriptional regulator [Cyclobacteriaceae bacterium]
MNIKEEIKQSRFRNIYQEVAINILYTSGWLANQHKDFFSQFGITSQQFNILSILRGQYPKQISGSEIKSRMMDKNSDVSRLLDRLLLKGLIMKTQSPEDKRAANIEITTQGLALLKASDAQVSAMDNILNNLTESEAEQLSRLLDKLRG